MVKNKTVKFGKIGGKNGKIGKCWSKKNLAQKTILVRKKMILKKSLLRGLVKNMSGKKLLTPKDFGPKKLN